MSSNYVKNPGNLQNLFNQIKDKKLSPVDLINSYINRINDTQKDIEQWKSYDFEKAIETAKLREQQVIDNNILGPLHGIPVGIKDIIHAEGFKTEFNCKAFKDTEVSKLDSGVVLALRSAGAIILGKTHTTEFAFYDPSPARNPHNPNHTLGDRVVDLVHLLQVEQFQCQWELKPWRLLIDQQFIVAFQPLSLQMVQ